MFIRRATVALSTAGTPPVAVPLVVASGPGATKQPRAAIFEASGATALGTPVALRVSDGMTDGSAQRSLGAMAEDAGLAGSMDSGTRVDTASVIDLPLTTTEARDGEASWNSWANGGANLDVNDLFATAVLASGTYFFGDDFDVALVEFTHTGALDSEQSVSGLPFAPNFVRAINPSHNGAAWSADASAADLAKGIGYAVKTRAGAIQQWAYEHFVNDRNVGGARVCSRLRADAVAVPISDSLTLPFDVRLELTAWNSDGATFTKRGTLGENITVALLFIRFHGDRPLWAGVHDFTETSAGNVSITTPGFAPAAYFAVGTLHYSSDGHGASTDGAAGKGSHGVYTGTESGYTAWSAESGAGTTATRCALGSDLVWRVIESGATAFSGAHVSIDPQGFTVAIDGANLAGYDEDGSKLVGFVAIGSVDAGWLPEVVRRRHKTETWGPGRS